MVKRDTSHATGAIKGAAIRNLRHLINISEETESRHKLSPQSLSWKFTSIPAAVKHLFIVLALVLVALIQVADIILITHVFLFVGVFGSILWLVRSEYQVASVKRSREASRPNSRKHNILRPVRQVGISPTREEENVRVGLFTFAEFMLYRLDYYLSNFWIAKPLGLILATYLLIVAGGALYFAAHGTLSLSESFWLSWTFVADPGSHADEETAATRFVSILVTLGGIFIFAVLIGVVADGVSDTLDALKQGRARVVEVGHTLILGWSDKVLPALAELAIANESEGGGVVVIMAEKDKTEMEKEIQEAFPRELLFGTSVVCRTGSSIMLSDLESVAASSAKSVIVVSEPNMSPDDSDAKSLRVVISLLGMGIGSHIVVEMCDIDNKELVQLVGRENVEIIVAHDIIGRLMIQCARQPGLAQILERILGFEGDEFYCKEWPQLLENKPEGTSGTVTFNQVCFRFANAIPIGVKPKNLKKSAIELLNYGPEEYGNQYKRIIKHIKDSKANQGSSVRDGEHNFVLLNPPGEYKIQPGDEIMVIAEDDDSYEPAVSQVFPDEQARKALASVRRMPMFKRDQSPEQVLFCGWRRDMDDMIKELDKLVCPGSMLTLFCTVPIRTREKRILERGLDVTKGLRNLTLHHRVGNPVLRKDLEQLRLSMYGSILVLADEAFDGNMQTADSRSLASLLLIRDLLNKQELAERKENAILSSTQLGSRLVFEQRSGEKILHSATGRALRNLRKHITVNVGDELNQEEEVVNSSDNQDVRKRSNSNSWADTKHMKYSSSSLDANLGDEPTCAISSELPDVIQLASVSKVAMGVLDTHSDEFSDENVEQESMGVANQELVVGPNATGSVSPEGAANQELVVGPNATASASPEVGLGMTNLPNSELGSAKCTNAYGGEAGTKDIGEFEATDLEGSEKAASSSPTTHQSHRSTCDESNVKFTAIGQGSSTSAPDGPEMSTNQWRQVIESGLCSSSGLSDYSSSSPDGSSQTRATTPDSLTDIDPSTDSHRSLRRRHTRIPEQVARPLLPRRRSCAGGDALRASGGSEETVIISEVLDSRTRTLISVTNVSDYVMSNEIVACAMAMVSEDASNNAIISELLSAEGSELHVRSCMEYCNAGESMCFWELLARTRSKGEIAIGYKTFGAPEAIINPRNKEQERSWHKGDLVVVLGRNS